MVIASSNPSIVVPQHALARRASKLSRKIYAAMPWGYRVAGLLTILAADALDAFGRTMSAEMVMSVVRGMPEIGGKPAMDWIQDVHRKGADVLPTGTGREFAARVYKILLTKFGDPEIAEEAMSAVLLASARKKIHIANGVSMHEAGSYIITACLNAARDLLRARGRRREDSLVRDRDEDSGQNDEVEDPRAFERLDEALPASELRKILTELGDVHPRAPEWLKARLDGQSGQEISEAWQTTPSYVSKWQRTYLPQIKKVVEHHLREASGACQSVYDYRPIACARGVW